MPTDDVIEKAMNLPEPPETWDTPIPYQLTPKGEEMAKSKLKPKQKNRIKRLIAQLKLRRGK